MRDESTIQKYVDALSDYWDLCQEDDDLNWKAEYIRNQINVLDWVLENSEAEDIFEEDVLHNVDAKDDEDY